MSTANKYNIDILTLTIAVYNTSSPHVCAIIDLSKEVNAIIDLSIETLSHGIITPASNLYEQKQFELGAHLTLFSPLYSSSTTLLPSHN